MLMNIKKIGFNLGIILVLIISNLISSIIFTYYINIFDHLFLTSSVFIIFGLITGWLSFIAINKLNLSLNFKIITYIIISVFVLIWIFLTLFASSHFANGIYTNETEINNKMQSLFENYGSYFIMYFSMLYLISFLTPAMKILKNNSERNKVKYLLSGFLIWIFLFFILKYITKIMFKGMIS
jgi:hypothetical protein